MNEIANLDETELYTAPMTFMGVPYSTDFARAGAAILGCPFDCGTHPFRVGARQGPHSIREQSPLVRRYQTEFADYDAISKLNLVDCGDVVLTPSRIEDAFARIEEAAFRIADAGAAPIGFGGDGSVSLPLIRAAARKYPGLAVLHVDSHTDAYPVDAEHKYDAATQFTHAASEQRVLPSLSYHIGLRGTCSVPGVYAFGRDLGYNLVTLHEFHELGAEAFVQSLKDQLQDRPVYLSWDMDVFDPSCAPGVCTPIWGGLSAREGLDLLRHLTGLNIVAADVNTVSPAQDVNGMTGFLAAAVTFEMILLIERARNACA